MLTLTILRLPGHQRVDDFSRSARRAAGGPPGIGVYASRNRIFHPRGSVQGYQVRPQPRGDQRSALSRGSETGLGLRKRAWHRKSYRSPGKLANHDGRDGFILGKLGMICHGAVRRIVGVLTIRWLSGARSAD